MTTPSDIAASCGTVDCVVRRGLFEQAHSEVDRPAREPAPRQVARDRPGRVSAGQAGHDDYRRVRPVPADG